MRRPTARLGSAGLALAAAALAACGSAAPGDLPPAARPDRSGTAATTPAGAVLPLTHDAAERAVVPARKAVLRGGRLAVVLAPRARELRLVNTASGRSVDRIAAGVGPTQVGCAPQGPCYVTDTTGDALLVVRVAADGRSMSIVRRVYVAGAPYAIAVDPRRRRIWVTLSARNELVELAAHGRPNILRRHAAVRQPDGVRVDATSGNVTVTGLRPPRTQLLVDPATPDRR